MHWHGVLLPNGMDGVAGLMQPHIEPGETYVYEFTLRQHGTLMYHPHSDEMVQMALGMMGFFIVHPRGGRAVDRDFAIMLHEWAIAPGTSRPNPAVMTDFNLVHVQQPRVAGHRAARRRRRATACAFASATSAWTATRSTSTATASRSPAPTAGPSRRPRAFRETTVDVPGRRDARLRVRRRRRPATGPSTATSRITR